MPILSADGISKRFGGVVALDAASFSCERGEIHALLGGNGAGKSTMVKVLCGVQPADGGAITFKDGEVRFKDPAEAGARGVVPVFQELSLIPDLTVAENLFMGREPRRFGLIDGRAMRRQAAAHFAALSFPPIDPGATVRDLPLADRQLVEIAKAIGREPDVLILDEATSALGQREVDAVFAAIRALKAGGMAIIFISHRMEEVQAICDRATVFRDGRDVATVDIKTTAPNEIVRLMIGRELDEVFPPRPERTGALRPALEAAHLSWTHTLRDISLTLNRGEIVGLSGLEGQGQGDLLFALFGVYAGLSGEVRVDGAPLRLGSPSAAMRAGIAMIPEDRKTQGLVLPLSVRENITLPTLPKLSTAGVIDGGDERGRCAEMVRQLGIKTASAETPVRFLSGGNQQKTAIAKWLLTGADIYLMYDPTRGIDVATKQELYLLIRQLADQGNAILFFSTDLPEIIGLCDRALVMYEGAIVQELDRAQLTKENLIAAALGLMGRQPERVPTVEAVA
ncbi:MAG: sugar ABC transporter ATP-binding protein [Thermomicrobiales bacterium]